MPTAWMPLCLYALRMGASVFRLKREQLHRAFDGKQIHLHKKHTPTPTHPQALVPSNALGSADFSEKRVFWGEKGHDPEQSKDLGTMIKTTRGIPKNTNSVKILRLGFRISGAAARPLCGKIDTQKSRKPTCGRRRSEKLENIYTCGVGCWMGNACHEWCLWLMRSG